MRATRLVDVDQPNAKTLRTIFPKPWWLCSNAIRGCLPWRSVGENVGLGLELSAWPTGIRDSKVAPANCAVGLDAMGRSRSLFGGLSGGMQHASACARLCDRCARSLLMDEPFSSRLDPLIRTHFAGRVAGLSAS